MRTVLTDLCSVHAAGIFLKKPSSTAMGGSAVVTAGVSSNADKMGHCASIRGAQSHLHSEAKSQANVAAANPSRW